MSHSLNATMRDEEDIERYQRQKYNGGLRAKRAAIGSNTRITNRPIETGTVYTDWGSLSAGRVIAGKFKFNQGRNQLKLIETKNVGVGIASALEPSSQAVLFKYDANNPGSGGGGNVPPPNNGGGFGGGFGGNNNNNNNNPPYNNNWQNAWQNGRKKRQAGGGGGLTFQPLQNLHAATLAGNTIQKFKSPSWPLT